MKQREHFYLLTQILAEAWGCSSADVDDGWARVESLKSLGGILRVSGVQGELANLSQAFVTLVMVHRDRILESED